MSKKSEPRMHYLHHPIHNASDKAYIAATYERASARCASAADAGAYADNGAALRVWGVVPFWAGGGIASHTSASTHQRVQGLRGTVCSMRRHMARVIVGACHDFLATAACASGDAHCASASSSPPPPLSHYDVIRAVHWPQGVEPVGVACKTGPFLVTRLQALVQRRLLSEPEVSFVYFTGLTSRPCCDGRPPPSRVRRR